MAQAFDFPLALLPPKLREIWELCGAEAAVAVWDQYGHGHISIPKSLSSSHELAERLGYRIAAALVAQYGGESFSVPAAVKAKTLCKQARIWHAFWHEHRTQHAIAREFNVSERWVSTICNRPPPLEAVLGAEDAQADLFGFDG